MTDLLNHRIVHTQEVTKVYHMGSQEVHALRGISLTVDAGEYISIMGPSGSGKSTFFNMIGGLDKPTSGEVYIDEVDISKLGTYELAWLRCRKIGYIFQTFNLIPVMTALENVTLPMTFAGMSADEARDKGACLLEKVGLGGRLGHRPPEMSGGQQQRVAIARALVNHPALILADEATGNLDSATALEILALFDELHAEGRTIVLVTHEPDVGERAQHVLRLKDGKIESVRRGQNSAAGAHA